MPFYLYEIQHNYRARTDRHCRAEKGKAGQGSVTELTSSKTKKNSMPVWQGKNIPTLCSFPIIVRIYSAIGTVVYLHITTAGHV